MANYDQLKEEITAKVVAALTEKLKTNVEEINEEEEEIEERKKRDTPRDSDRREDAKLKVNEQEADPREKEEELQERWSDDVPPEIEFGDASSSRARPLKYGERDKIKRKKAEEETVEEAVSNDQWYQSELFESLKKRWTK